MANAGHFGWGACVGALAWTSRSNCPLVWGSHWASFRSAMVALSRCKQGQFLIQRVPSTEAVERGQQDIRLLVIDVPNHRLGGLIAELAERLVRWWPLMIWKKPRRPAQGRTTSGSYRPVRSIFRTSLSKFVRLIRLGLPGCGTSLSNAMCLIFCGRHRLDLLCVHHPSPWDSG